MKADLARGPAHGGGTTLARSSMLPRPRQANQHTPTHLKGTQVSHSAHAGRCPAAAAPPAASAAGHTTGTASILPKAVSSAGTSAKGTCTSFAANSRHCCCQGASLLPPLLPLLLPLLLLLSCHHCVRAAVHGGSGRGARGAAGAAAARA